MDLLAFRLIAIRVIIQVVATGAEVFLSSCAL